MKRDVGKDDELDENELLRLEVVGGQQHKNRWKIAYMKLESGEISLRHQNDQNCDV